MARILVLDDDKILNDMIVQLLTEAGYAAEGVRNGKDGLKLFETKPFDLIVTDIVMPEKEGLETILAIRSKNKTIPVIAISGGSKMGEMDYLCFAQMLGADYTFQKPFDNDALVAAVRECLSGI
jgi:DNA-binding response OmpR family regulator